MGTVTDKTTVPLNIRHASEWAWRLLLIVAGLYVLARIVGILSDVVIPVAIALLLAALLRPVTLGLSRHMARGPASAITVFGAIIVMGGLLTLVGQQFTTGFSDLTNEVANGIGQIQTWITTTFHLSDRQFTQGLDGLKGAIGSSGSLTAQAAAVGLTATHFIAGLAIAFFTLIFFLYDGPRIWGWVVRLFPRVARDRVDSSGQIAWHQLAAYVRATVAVAFIDGAGIGIGAAILKVPFAFPIAVLVFLFAFIPIVGSILSGAVAVLLALVAHGLTVALIMLAVVLGVNQLEAHVLQPFLLGRSVRVHPLAVVLGLASGAIVAGIVGALLAVPLMAIANAVGKHLLEGETPRELDEELQEPAEEGHAPAKA